MESRNIHEILARLVSIALKTPDLSVLREVFLDITSTLGGYGCALWHMEPPLPGSTRPSSDARITRDKLVAIAAGFRSRVAYPQHDLPLTIPSGIAMREGNCVVSDLGQTKAFPERAVRFLAQTGIESLCAVRANFGDGTLGALTLYRQRPGSWASEDIEILEYLATRIPQIYETVRDRVSFRMLDRISAILQVAEERLATEATIKEILESVCRAVADGFQCLETSIFLEDPLKSPGVFRNIATTCPELLHCDSYTLDQEGLTPWVARNGPIAVSDVQDFDQSDYEGLRWTDRVRLDSTVRTLLKLQENEVTPPVSFMAVPIRMGNTVHGVIRCCAARGSPFYFSGAETDLLTIVASRVAHFWDNLIARRDLNRELDMWRRFVAAVGVLNKTAQDALSTAADNQLAMLLTAAIGAVRETLQGADYIDVSLFDPSAQELVLAHATPSEERAAGSTPLAQRRVRVNEDPPQSPEAWVFRHRITLRVHSNGLFGRHVLETFPGFRHAIYSPILVDGRFLGLIAARGKSTVDYPLRADQTLELLGRLTGLHYHLQYAFKKQAQTYKVFVHQLRNPIFQAWRRAQKLRLLTGSFGLPGSADRYVDAVCGLLGKARRLVINLRLFANLEAGLPVRTDQSTLAPSELVRTLIELASDNQILWKHSRILFHVERDSFSGSGSISVDMDLFEQVAGNVLDNFGRYGRPDSTTTVGSYVRQGREIAISFRGRSIPTVFPPSAPWMLREQARKAGGA